jgi:hypothetical protein
MNFENLLYREFPVKLERELLERKEPQDQLALVLSMLGH